MALVALALALAVAVVAAATATTTTATVGGAPRCCKWSSGCRCCLTLILVPAAAAAAEAAVVEEKQVPPSTARQTARCGLLSPHTACGCCTSFCHHSSPTPHIIITSGTAL